jgi:CDP-6-deoxy-D-xylo-4-hexulose-3-dehydrase
MNIDDEIMKLIKNLGENFNILNYVYNNNAKFIPGVSTVLYSGPYFDEKEIAAAIKALLIGRWISSGENVRLFEMNFSKKIHQEDGVMLNSGSSANLILLATLKKYFNWQDDDEIIVSVVGFPTTIAPIIQNNLKPVFIDIEMQTLNFDLNLIENKITERTKAIFVSPVLGNPPDFDYLINLCEKYHILLILDNCDSLGSKWKGKFLNEYSVASSYSFYPAHHISTGEGGMVTSNDIEFIKLARSFSWWGRACYCVGSANMLPNGTCNKRFGRWLDNYDGNIDHKYIFENMGYNLKPLDLQGAIGNVQLQKIDEIHTRRKRSHDEITKIFLKHLPFLKVPEVLPQADISWFGTPFICENRKQKENLINYLEKLKVQTRNFFAGNILIHPGYSYLDDYKNYPQANKVLDLVFFVGAAPHYEQNIFDYFEEIIGKYYE